MDEIENILKKNGCVPALKDWKRYVKEEQDHARAYLKIGYCSIETKQYDNALKAFRRAEEISPGIEPRLGIQLVHLKKGEYDKSITEGGNALSQDPYNYTARIRIAEAFLAQEQYSKAEKEIQEISGIHGKNADLVWNLGRIRYLQGDKEEAFRLYENAYELDPTHPFTRSSLGLWKNRFSIELTPLYSHYHFSKNSIKSSGERRGGYATLTLFDKWTLGGGHTLDTVGNLSDTGGNYQTYFSDVNVLYYPIYNTPALLQTYYNLPINQYFYYNNLFAADFRVHQSSGHISYAPDIYSKIKVSHHKIESNELYTDGSAITDISYTFGKEIQFGISGTRILFPKHNGYQGNFTIKFTPFSNFTLESNFIGETVNIQNYKASLISLNPYYVRSYEEYDRSNLGAVQQSFIYSFRYMSFGGGGRAGELYTPMLGDMPILNPALLKSGAFGFITLHPFENFSLTISNSRDYWKNAYGEKPHSDQTKIMGSFKF